MTENVQRLKDVRAAYKGHNTRAMDKATAMMSSGFPDVEELRGMLEAITLRESKIACIDDKLENAIPTEELEAEIKHAIEYRDTIRNFKKKVTATIQREAEKTTDVDGDKSMGARNIKLPKLKVKEFNGDSLEWLSFWDCFEASVHLNRTISDVSKMNYLKSLLRGEALRAISGLALTKSNYSVAIELLKNRFGQEQVQVNAHRERHRRSETRAGKSLYFLW